MGKEKIPRTDSPNKQAIQILLLNVKVFLSKVKSNICNGDQIYFNTKRKLVKINTTTACTNQTD